MKLQKCCILPSIFLFSCTVSIFAGTMGELNRPYHAEETLDSTHHHFALGTAYTNYPSSSFWGTLGGMTEHFFWRLAAAGVLLRHQPPEVGSFNLACGTAIAAYRHPFTTNFGLDVGPAFGYQTTDRTVPNGTQQYSVGAFVGLDYILSNHFLIQAGIQPYSYRRIADHTVFHGIFELGTLGVAYLF